MIVLIPRIVIYPQQYLPFWQASPVLSLTRLKTHRFWNYYCETAIIWHSSRVGCTSKVEVDPITFLKLSGKKSLLVIRLESSVNSFFLMLVWLDKIIIWIFLINWKLCWKLVEWLKESQWLLVSITYNVLECDSFSYGKYPFLKPELQRDHVMYRSVRWN